MGTVSVVSNISSIPEVCGNSAFYFNPYNVSDIANSITQGLVDQQSLEAKKNLLEQQLQRFSWEKNAMETLKVYKNIVE